MMALTFPRNGLAFEADIALLPVFEQVGAAQDGRLAAARRPGDDDAAVVAADESLSGTALIFSSFFWLPVCVRRLHRLGIR